MTETLQGERLEIRYIPLSQAILWDENPKQHDIGAICTSIARYGFQDPPKFDAALGALVYGNGRTHALSMMQQQRAPVPRGICTDDDGAWYVPVAFGLDLGSQAVARAFALDHNNLTMAGGAFTALDMARMWDDDAYTRMMAELAENDTLPVTVDGDDLDALMFEFDPTFFPVNADEQPRLDQKSPITCPHCGREFIPSE